MKTIVIIDDVESILECLKTSLGEMGLNVVTFRKPLDAIREIPELPTPDIIVVDYLMFDMTGLELIVILRALGIHCPYILFTAIYEDDVPQRCHDMGVIFVDKKYFVKDAIRHVLRTPYAN
jgi:CheY-like chemotaxis protein